MSVNIREFGSRGIRYLGIALRETVIWSYTPIICIPTVWLALFFTREYYFSETDGGIGMMSIVYGVLLILGICMGAVAAGHLLNGKKADAYLLAPIGRRRLMAIRLITMLFLCAVLILITYVGFYFFTGAENPRFYENEAYFDVIAPSGVWDLSVRYSGAGLWCLYGVREFSFAFVPFFLGYGIGAFCSVLSSFPVFSMLHAILLLVINAASVLPLTWTHKFGITSAVISAAVSPVWFIAWMGVGEFVEKDSVTLCWTVASVLLLALAVAFAPSVRAERRGRFLASGKFALFYLFYIALSVGLFCFIYYAPDSAARVVRWLFGIDLPVFLN